MSEIELLNEKEKKTKQFYRWALTIYDENELNVMKENENIKYWIYGVEKCPSTNRIHYQSYIELKVKKTFNSIKKVFNKAHIEPAIKPAAANIKYCMKDNNYIQKCEHSEVNKQGQRTDLLKLSDRLQNGESIKDILLDSNDSTLFKISSLIKAQQIINDTPRDFKPTVYVYWGLSGCGKTYQAKTYTEHYYIITMPVNNNLWWDGYDPNKHKTVIFDEFSGWIPFNMFKNICDNIPYQVPIKGGFVQFKPETIIFTSNKHPKYWYKTILNNEIDYKAFFRRIDKIQYFNQVYKECDKMPEDNTPEDVLKEQEILYYNEQYFNISENKDLMI